jgi:hypothetical protein
MLDDHIVADVLLVVDHDDANSVNPCHSYGKASWMIYPLLLLLFVVVAVVVVVVVGHF